MSQTEFMAREIESQPETWRQGARLGAGPACPLPAAGLRVAVVGCGTSWFMAQAYAARREAAGQGVTEVAVWEQHWTPRNKPSQTFRLQLFSDGHTNTPGGATWEKKGSTLTFYYKNGSTDVVTLSTDGRSYDGYNTTRRNRVWGKLLSQKPMP